MKWMRKIHHLLIYLSPSKFDQSSSVIKKKKPVGWGVEDLDCNSYYYELKETGRTGEIKPFKFHCRELYHQGKCLNYTSVKKNLDVELIAIFLTSF